MPKLQVQVFEVNVAECTTVDLRLMPKTVKRTICTGWANELQTYYLSTNCATMCANEACFVRLECDTGSIAQAHNNLDYYYLPHSYSI